MIRDLWNWRTCEEEGTGKVRTIPGNGEESFDMLHSKGEKSQEPKKGQGETWRL